MNRHIYKPKISVIVNFYNMQREAKRTLYSLTTDYQIDVNEDEFEVIVLDNGSSMPLEENWVNNLDKNFKYLFYDTQSPSPCAALNFAVRHAAADMVMCCIDGARILSPGILKHTLAAANLHKKPFIYTLGMHLGHKLQNYAIKDGYNQQVEDQLLETVDWRNNGYELFHISSLAYSSKNGFYSELTESNCFSMKKTDFIEIGGFDEKFTSAGGGLTNLDIFNRVHEDDSFTPVMLLGEATFHQFHGGVATNVSIEDHPWEKIESEYKNIRGKPFESVYRYPEYYGSLSTEYHSLLMKI